MLHGASLDIPWRCVRCDEAENNSASKINYKLANFQPSSIVLPRSQIPRVR